jgi:hypothetical protein
VKLGVFRDALAPVTCLIRDTCDQNERLKTSNRHVWKRNCFGCCMCQCDQTAVSGGGGGKVKVTSHAPWWRTNVQNSVHDCRPGKVPLGQCDSGRVETGAQSPAKRVAERVGHDTVHEVKAGLLVTVQLHESSDDSTVGSFCQRNLPPRVCGRRPHAKARSIAGSIPLGVWFAVPGDSIGRK